MLDRNTCKHLTVCKQTGFKNKLLTIPPRSLEYINFFETISILAGDSVTLCIPLCICRLTLEWIAREISTKLLGMPTHLDQSSLTAARLYLMRLVSQMSGFDSQPPLCVSRRQLLSVGPFFQLLTGVPFLLPAALRSRVQTLWLVSR